MSYIGDTKIKKIKKLYLLTKAIIQSYGLKYFFYVAKLELKKQGLSMFSPDDSPIPSFLQENYQQTYDEYLKKMNYHLSTHYSNLPDDINSNILLIILFDGRLENLQSTLNSLKKQNFTNFKYLYS